MGGKEAAEKQAGKGNSIPFELGGEGSVSIPLDLNWAQTRPTAFVSEFKRRLEENEDLNRVGFHGKATDPHNPVMIGVLVQCIRHAKDRNLETDLGNLPSSMRKLIKLAIAVSPHVPARKIQEPLVREIGRKAFMAALESIHFIQFLGELTFSFARLLAGKARFRRRDFWVTLQECGVNALPIVGLLALLTGIILAFIGAVQLRKFGATIYVTDLVGLAMAREMACIMTGVIMSGRTGAAFAAQIGSMNVNQEVDALETLGLSPVEFLVLPRTMALILMLPLLTMYANVLGWFGGFIVAVPMNINAPEYWLQLKESLNLSHILFGLSKSFFFAIIIAACGCYYGMRSGRNSAAVGQAATKAVVASITWIVVVDALFAFMDEVLN